MKKKDSSVGQKEKVTRYVNSKIKLDLIEKKASNYFYKLLSYMELKTDSLEGDELERVNDARNIFIKVIRGHILTHEMKVVEVLNPNLSVIEQMMTPPKADLTELPEEKIDEVITLYAAPVVFFLHILKPYSKGLEKELAIRLGKLSDSKKLKENDPAYIRYMDYVEEILNKNLTKYRVVKNYKNSHQNIKQSEKSESNAFDSFLKNHKADIMKKHKLNEQKFSQTFFPATPSQK